MRAIYLVANAAWVVTFGEQIIPISDVRFHDTRTILSRRLREIGLGLSANNNVFTR